MVMKKAMQDCFKQGSLGIKVSCFKQAEIARKERYREGRGPLHTLRADISNGLTEAITTYGVIGIKMWVDHTENRGK